MATRKNGLALRTALSVVKVLMVVGLVASAGCLSTDTGSEETTELPAGETTTESVTDRTTDRETATSVAETTANEETSETTTTTWTATETTSESQSDRGIVIDGVRADASGKDGENLNGERIELKNTGSEPVNVTDWEIRDEENNTFAFPDGFVLDPGASVVVHSGAGENSSNRLYWHASEPIWDNDGDFVRVYDETGELCGPDCSREVLEVQ